MIITITLDDDNRLNVKISKNQGIAVTLGVLEITKTMIINGDIKPDDIKNEVVTTLEE